MGLAGAVPLLTDVASTRASSLPLLIISEMGMSRATPPSEEGLILHQSMVIRAGLVIVLGFVSGQVKVLRFASSEPLRKYREVRGGTVLPL